MTNKARFDRRLLQKPIMVSLKCSEAENTISNDATETKIKIHTNNFEKQ